MFSDVAKVLIWTWVRTSLDPCNISVCASSVVASMNRWSVSGRMLLLFSAFRLNYVIFFNHEIYFHGMNSIYMMNILEACFSLYVSEKLACTRKLLFNRVKTVRTSFERCHCCCEDILGLEVKRPAFISFDGVAVPTT